MILAKRVSRFQTSSYETLPKPSFDIYRENTAVGISLSIARYFATVIRNVVLPIAGRDPKTIKTSLLFMTFSNIKSSKLLAILILLFVGCKIKSDLCRIAAQVAIIFQKRQNLSDCLYRITAIFLSFTLLTFDATPYFIKLIHRCFYN